VDSEWSWCCDSGEEDSIAFERLPPKLVRKGERGGERENEHEGQIIKKHVSWSRSKGGNTTFVVSLRPPASPSKCKVS